MERRPIPGALTLEDALPGRRERLLRPGYEGDRPLRLPPEPQIPPPPANQPPLVASATTPEAASPPGKRLEISAAELEAERSRLALAELSPRMDRLVQSGKMAAAVVPRWSGSARSLRDELHTSMAPASNVIASDLVCFQLGCLFTFDAYDEGARVQAHGRLRMLLRGEMPNPFTGEHFVSGPVKRDDGSLRTTVILYRPSDVDGNGPS